MDLTPRHAELIRLFVAHFRAEEEQDIPKTLLTMTDDVVYEHPLYGDHPDRVFQGHEKAADYYRRTWPISVFEGVEVARSWLHGDDTLIAEVHGLVGPPGKSLRKAATVVVGVFRDGLLAREIVYTQPH